MTFDQQEFEIRFEWGEHGVATLAPISDVLIIVDVLSFSTSVEIAVNRGAVVFPFRWRDDRAVDYAASVGAVLATHRPHAGYSLSPELLMDIPSWVSNRPAIAKWRHTDAGREADTRHCRMFAKRTGGSSGSQPLWTQDRPDRRRRAVEG